MRYAQPGTEGSVVSFKSRYGNYIGGEFVAPVKGQYFTNTSPVNGKPIAEFPRSTAEDIEKALDAAHAAADAWGATSVQARSLVLLKIADRIEQNLELLAVTETWDNGKAVRETLNADVPLAADHFRYYAGCIRAQEGSAAEIDRAPQSGERTCHPLLYRCPRSRLRPAVRGFARCDQRFSAGPASAPALRWRPRHRLRRGRRRGLCRCLLRLSAGIRRWLCRSQARYW